VPRGVVVFQWIVYAVAIPVKCLRVGRVWHNRIRTYKPPDTGIIVPGSVIVKVNAVVQALAGKEDIGGEIANGRLTISTVSVRVVLDGAQGAAVGAATVAIPNLMRMRTT
jgi:hypothetical protein